MNLVEYTSELLQCTYLKGFSYSFDVQYTSLVIVTI